MNGEDAFFWKQFLERRHLGSLFILLDGKLAASVNLFGHEDRFILSVCFFGEFYKILTWLIWTEHGELSSCLYGGALGVPGGLLTRGDVLAFAWCGDGWDASSLRQLSTIQQQSGASESSFSQGAAVTSPPWTWQWQDWPPQHAAAGGPTQASKIVSELDERFNFRLWELGPPLFFFFAKSVVAYHPFLTHLPTSSRAANKTFIVLCHDVA